MVSELGKFIQKIELAYSKVITFLLVSCTFIVLFLSVLVIVLRWFQTTLMWYDPFVRHLVFALAFLGGVKATEQGSHISIDLLGRSLSNHENKLIAKLHAVFLGLCAMTILGWLTYAGLKFVEVEIAYGRPVFFGIHSSYLVGIIPVGFAMIALQFLLQVLLYVTGSREVKV